MITPVPTQICIYQRLEKYCAWGVVIEFKGRTSTMHAYSAGVSFYRKFRVGPFKTANQYTEEVGELKARFGSVELLLNNLLCTADKDGRLVDMSFTPVITYPLQASSTTGRLARRNRSVVTQVLERLVVGREELTQSPYGEISLFATPQIHFKIRLRECTPEPN